MSGHYLVYLCHSKEVINWGQATRKIRAKSAKTDSLIVIMIGIAIAYL